MMEVLYKVLAFILSVAGLGRLLFAMNVSRDLGAAMGSLLVFSVGALALALLGVIIRARALQSEEERAVA